MESRQQDQIYINQFKLGLQRKVLNIIATMLMVSLIVYTALVVWKAAHQIDAIQNSEFSYLNRLVQQLQYQKQLEWQRVLWVLDGWGTVVTSGGEVDTGGSGVCNGERFECGWSISADNYTLADKLYSSIADNSYLVSDTISANDSLEINLMAVLLYSQTQTIYLNLPSHNLTSSTPSLPTSTRNAIHTHLDSSLPTADTTQYLFFNIQKELQVVSNFTYRVEVVCLRADVDGGGVFLCIMRQQELLVGLGQARGNMLFQQHNQQLLQGTPFLLPDYVRTISQHVIPKNYFQDSYAHMLDCLQKYPLYSASTLTGPIALPCTRSLHEVPGALGPFYPFVYLRFSILLTTPTRLPLELHPSLTLPIQLYVSSNSSYYQSLTETVNYTINQIMRTWMVVLLLMSLLFILLVFTMDILQQQLMPNINFILKLCELLKTKEEKEFNRVIQNYHPTLLTFFIEYFRQYFWIYHISKSKGRAKYKNHLITGLHIFQSDHYASVLEFIYHELIWCDTQLIDKMLKVKELPSKKKDKNQQQERLIPRRKTISKPSQTPPQHHSRPTTIMNQRRKANRALFDPQDQKLLKNIVNSFRGNRGVRFSNDIQTIEIDSGPILRKARLLQQTSQMQSCQTIKNDLSQIDEGRMEEDFRQLREEQSSMSWNSFNSASRTSTRKHIGSLKGLGGQGSLEDFDLMKLDESFDSDSDLDSEEEEEDWLYGLNRQSILQEMGGVYERTIGYYEQLIALKVKQMEALQQEGQNSQVIIQIYSLTLRKYQKVLEWLTAEGKKDLANYEHIANFQDMHRIESIHGNYLRHEEVQRGEVLRACIQHALRLPFSLKNVQFLAKAKVKQVRMMARCLLAQAAEQLQPHLDMVLVDNLCLNLCEPSSRNPLKLQYLHLLTTSLERYPIFVQQVYQVRMARQFYNNCNKKFYFIVSIHNHKNYQPLLTKLHELIHPFDLITIYYLDRQQEYPLQLDQVDNTTLPKPRKRPTNDKIKYLLELESFLEMFQCPARRGREEDGASTARNAGKMAIYQNQFYDVMGSIEGDEVEFSKWVVVLLEEGAGSGEEDSSSSGNHRPYLQRIHQEIVRIIEKGYLHFIVAGQHLDGHHSRFGRIKKYLRAAPQLLSVEMADKDQHVAMQKLQAFLK